MFFISLVKYIYGWIKNLWTWGYKNKNFQNGILKRQKKRARRKTEQNIQELWENHKRYNRHLIGNTRRRRKEQKQYVKQPLRIFKYYCQTPKHRSKKLREHKAGQMKKKKKSQHIVFKSQKWKDEENILKRSHKKKSLTNREAKIRITSDYSSEIM